MSADKQVLDYNQHFSVLGQTISEELAQRSDSTFGLVDRHFAESLDQLESRLAGYCAGRVRELLDQFALKGITNRVSALNTLISVRDVLGQRLGRAVDSPILDSLWSLLAILEKEALAAAEARMTHVLGELVEYFGGAGGWIYALTPPDGYSDGRRTDMAGVEKAQMTLRSVISLNAVHQRPLRFRGYGIIGHTALLHKGLLYNRVREYSRQAKGEKIYPYEELVPTTQSEIAVPVYCANDTVAAVLNIEATLPNRFTPLNIAEMAALARRLVPDLRLSMRIRDRSSGFAWHPDVHGWSLTRLLNRICLALATPFPDASTSLALSCTIWHADHDARQLHVLGTARFDYEYITSRSLSFASFIGDVIVKPSNRGKVITTSVASAKGFRRIDKATHMDIRHVIATPLWTAGADRAFGALAIYVYGSDPFDHSSQAATLFRDDVVLRIADLVGRVIDESWVAQAQYAEELTASRLFAESHPGREDLAIIQKTVRECLTADSSSIFLARGGPIKRLHCAATSGLVMNGIALDGTDDVVVRDLEPDKRRIDNKLNLVLKAVAYPAADPNAPATDRGFTESLGDAPGSWIRTNDVPSVEADRIKLPSTVQRAQDGSPSVVPPSVKGVVPRNLYCEQYATSEYEHRRFLGYSIPDELQRAAGHIPCLGVIRAIRASHSEPFIAPHERILEVVAERGALHLEAREYDLSRRASELFWATTNTMLKARPETWLSKKPKGKKDPILTKRSLDRLLCETAAFLSWNPQCVDALLMDLLEATRGFEPLYASVSIATRDEADHDVMKIFRIQSPLRRLPDDHIQMVQGSIGLGLLAIELRSVLLFIRDGVRDCPLFASVDAHLLAGDSKWGLVAPFSIFTPAGECDCVLSLEFAELPPALKAAWADHEASLDEVPDLNWILQIVWCAIVKAGMISGDNSPRQRDVVRTLLASLRNGGDPVSWYCDHLASHTDRKTLVKGLAWDFRFAEKAQRCQGEAGQAEGLANMIRLTKDDANGLLKRNPSWVRCHSDSPRTAGGTRQNLSLSLDRDLCATRLYRSDSAERTVIAMDEGSSIRFRIPLRLGCHTIGYLASRIEIDAAYPIETIAAAKALLGLSDDLPIESERKFLVQWGCLGAINELEYIWRAVAYLCSPFSPVFRYDRTTANRSSLLCGTALITPSL